eukprot:SAG31_NODE_1996_length_6700_cov_4.398424_1_plen_67_part_00
MRVPVRYVRVYAARASHRARTALLRAAGTGTGAAPAPRPSTYIFFKKIALYYGTICNTNSEEGSQK